MKVNIKTNHQPRDLVSWELLPEAVRTEHFPDVTGDDQFAPRYVQYRERWYDTSDCDGLARNIEIAGWDLYQSDSFYSGIVFRWPLADPPRTAADGDPVYDYDRVIVGTYIAA